MKYLEINFGCSYSLPINIVEVHVFFVDNSVCKMHLTPSRSLSIYLYSNVFIVWALHIAILPACQRDTLERFWVSEKVFSHQIRWLWFQHDVNRSFRQSNQTGYKNFKRSLRIDFFSSHHMRLQSSSIKKNNNPTISVSPSP